MNLKELLIGDPVRLRYVQRFSTCHVVHRESVAEHSYYVALYAMVVADWCVKHHCENAIGSTIIDFDCLLRRALIHDLEEARTGDVVRMFKYSTPEIKETMDRGARNEMLRMMQNLYAADTWMDNDYVGMWDNAKDKTYEGRIISFCDYLSVLSYMVQELSNSNITMRQHWQTMNEYMATFDAEEYDFIRPLVDDARQLLHDAFLAGVVTNG